LCGRSLLGRLLGRLPFSSRRPATMRARFRRSIEIIEIFLRRKKGTRRVVCPADNAVLFTWWIDINTVALLSHSQSVCVCLRRRCAGSCRKRSAVSRVGYRNEQARQLMIFIRRKHNIRYHRESNLTNRIYIT